MTATMPPSSPPVRAVVAYRYGSADAVELTTIARPTIGPDEVLIAVEAAGLDRGVWHLLTGRPYLVRLMGFGLRAPKQPILGLDVAGRVVAVGNEVTRFRPGDDVFGIAKGAFAEFAAAAESKLVAKPAEVSFEQAAVTSVSGCTALQALEDEGQMQAGQRVLIVGASGGVGSFAVQLAVALGGVVTGVCSASKAEFVRSLGASRVIDYTREALDAEGVRYDLVLDIGGRNSIAQLRGVLAPSGRLVMVGGEGGDRLTGGMARQLYGTLLSPFVGQRLAMLISTEHHSIIERLAEHLRSGTVTPAIDRHVALDEVPGAIRALELGEIRGKVVVDVAGSR